MEDYLDEEHRDEACGESHRLYVLLGAAHQLSGVVLPEEVLVLGKDAAEGLFSHASLHGGAYAVRRELLDVFRHTCDEIDHQHGYGYGEEKSSLSAYHACVYYFLYVFRPEGVQVYSDDKEYHGRQV